MKNNPDNVAITRDIAFVVFPGFQIQDLSGPLATFEIAGNLAGCTPYCRYVVSLNGGPVLSSSGLAVMTEKISPDRYDTLILVGGDVVANLNDLLAISEKFKPLLAGKHRRIASVCTGVFILAANGLLAGRKATTHWKYSARLQQLFPDIKVDSNRIFINDGPIWSSAGVSAGIDMALAMIEGDLGTAISRSTAQMMVVYHRRPGGQSQFSALADMEPQSDRIRIVLTYIRNHISDELTVEKLSEIACLSARQFSRIFKNETGYTPAKAVERVRTEVARQHLEDGGESVDIIARRVGYGDAERMRRAFIRVAGMPPQSIKRIASEDNYIRDA